MKAKFTFNDEKTYDVEKVVINLDGEPTDFPASCIEIISEEKEKDKKQRDLEIAEWFFDLVGVFNHYGFFREKLWNKVKGFEKTDEAEIKVMFMHLWFHHKFGYWTTTCGSGWFAELGEECCDEDYKEFQPVVDAYIEWVGQQR